MSSFVVMAVVAAEHHHGVLVESQSREFVQQPAHVTVHSTDHGGLPFVLIAPGLVAVDAVVRNLLAVTSGPSALVVGVGNRQGEVEGKGLISVSLHEVQSFLCDQIVAVVDSLGGIATGVTTGSRSHLEDGILQPHLALVAPQKLGIVIVRVALVQIAVEIVETLIQGKAGPCSRQILPQTPLSAESGP